MIGSGVLKQPSYHSSRRVATSSGSTISFVQNVQQLLPHVYMFTVTSDELDANKIA